MTSLTRGPLPAHVYWRRRALVLGLPLALVLVIGQLLGGSSDGSAGGGQAAVVSADGATNAADADPGAGATAAADAEESSGKSGRRGKRRRAEDRKPPEPVLAEPQGRCAGEDIAVTPEVDDAVAGRDVTISLALRSLESPACTWLVSPKNLTLKITSGPDFIWSSQHCSSAVPRREVVVRNNATTTVEVVWPDAKRSDEDCSRYTEWAMPGWYHVNAAALAGEPSDAQFELATPVAETITKTATPKNGTKNGKKKQR